MKTGLVIVVAALALTGCETTTTTADGTVTTSAPVIANISDEAKTVMEARGLPLSALFRGDKGCYAIEVEVTNPRSGVPLKRADGSQICDKA